MTYPIYKKTSETTTSHRIEVSLRELLKTSNIEYPVNAEIKVEGTYIPECGWGVGSDAYTAYDLDSKIVIRYSVKEE